MYASSCQFIDFPPRTTFSFTIASVNRRIASNQQRPLIREGFVFRELLRASSYHFGMKSKPRACRLVRSELPRVISFLRPKAFSILSRFRHSKFSGICGGVNTLLEMFEFVLIPCQLVNVYIPVGPYLFQAPFDHLLNRVAPA